MFNLDTLIVLDQLFTSQDHRLLETKDHSTVGTVNKEPNVNNQVCRNSNTKGPTQGERRVHNNDLQTLRKVVRTMQDVNTIFS